MLYKLLLIMQVQVNKTHREFGGGLGVRWVAPEQWAAEAEALPGAPSFDLLLRGGPVERIVLLRNLRNERSFR